MKIHQLKKDSDLQRHSKKITGILSKYCEQKGMLTILMEVYPFFSLLLEWYNGNIYCMGSHWGFLSIITNYNIFLLLKIDLRKKCFFRVRIVEGRLKIILGVQYYFMLQKRKLNIIKFITLAFNSGINHLLRCSLILQV